MADARAALNERGRSCKDRVPRDGGIEHERAPMSFSGAPDGRSSSV